MKKLVNKCPVCSSLDCIPYTQDKFRSFLICQGCGLIFVPRLELIDAHSEKTRYESHENDETDPHYKSYLNQIVTSVLPDAKKGSKGLDFGCGRTTLLAQLFEDRAFLMDSYDLYFLPDEKIWDKTYDFIVLSEVIEHLREPLELLNKLRLLLNPQGKIFIKTKLHPGNKERFDQWFYKRDITHVQFFNESSLEKLSGLLNLERPVTLSGDLFILRS